MDAENNNGGMTTTEDPLKQNEEFLKHHKEITMNDPVYCKDAIERIEEECHCKVICNPHFSGITYYVENQHYDTAKAIVRDVIEKEKALEARESRREIKKVETSKKIRQRLDEKMAACEQPNESELKFTEKCLMTLRLKDYVQKADAETYRLLYKKYSEYFTLKSWPEEVVGDTAKKYINMTLFKNI
jgi:hypothetical protein